jgi:Zn-dependent protease
MRDLMSFSLSLGRWFGGVNVRIHWMFFLFIIPALLRTAFFPGNPGHPDDKLPDGSWIDMACVLGLLTLSVLAHEYGHCIGAWSVNGSANEILIWPLGGLAFVDVPHTPRANFITTAAGPAVNLVVCLVCAALLLVVHGDGRMIQPHWWKPWDGFIGRDWRQEVALYDYAWGEVKVAPLSVAAFVHWTFWVNYVLFLLNMILVGFPMDAGRLLQAALWPRLGYRQATQIAVYAGFVTGVLLAVFGMYLRELTLCLLALFIWLMCWRQYMILETGGDDALLGHYDFSQGYTSLERDEPPARRPRRKSWWRRWLAEREARKRQRDHEQRESEERRLDDLLDKVQRLGVTALTDEERRFMKRVSDRYRNRQ